MYDFINKLNVLYKLNILWMRFFKEYQDMKLMQLQLDNEINYINILL